ncbi:MULTISPECIES: hypothetical protein [unclassified Sphingomonas]|jgi:hypothetical protein|uniref:hypothetical protein n=1 Tax=unclassified Sphingomonas TaxID=196159 RepID=UPI00083363C2|nr:MULTISPECIES: hypothetical protein [unclassified Sphingomonas]
MRAGHLAVLALACAAPSFAPASALARAPGEARETRHVTQTYLRAKPGLRADLIAYLRANWFAMDRIGVERGLFTSYALLERGDESQAEWDVIVTVGYPTEAGYDAPGVAEAFQAIRAAHREVKIGGRGFAELGEIVQHHPLAVVTHNP